MARLAVADAGGVSRMGRITRGGGPRLARVKSPCWLIKRWGHATETVRIIGLVCFGSEHEYCSRRNSRRTQRNPKEMCPDGRNVSSAHTPKPHTPNHAAAEAGVKTWSMRI